MLKSKILNILAGLCALAILISSAYYYSEVLFWPPFQDDWEYIYSGLTQPLNTSYFLKPHNGHPALITRLIFHGLDVTHQEIVFIRGSMLFTQVLSAIFLCAIFVEYVSNRKMLFLSLVLAMSLSLSTWGVLTLSSNGGWLYVNFLLIFSIWIINKFKCTLLCLIILFLCSVVSAFSFGNGIFVPVALAIVFIDSAIKSNTLRIKNLVIALTFIGLTISVMLGYSMSKGSSTNVDLGSLIAFFELLGSPITMHYNNESLPWLAFFNGAFIFFSVCYLIHKFKDEKFFGIVSALVGFSFLSAIAVVVSRYSNSNFDLFHNHRYSASSITLLVSLIFLLYKSNKKISFLVIGYLFISVSALQYQEYSMLIHRSSFYKNYNTTLIQCNYSEFETTFIMPQSLQSQVVYVNNILNNCD